MRAVDVVLVTAPAARADYRISGHGYGHGVGLAQYGAMGYAKETRHTVPLDPLALLPRHDPRHGAEGADAGAAQAGRRRARRARHALMRGGDGRTVTLSRTHSYRFEPWGTDGLAVTDRTTGRSRAHMHAPVRLTGPAPLRVLGVADNGVKDGRYRGAIVLRRDAAQVLVVDDAGLEDYLLGVVPAEMPASWPAEALRSQAVVARSYALTSRSPVEPFDVFADTRSQVYRGVDAESPRSTDAVRATGGIVLMFGTTVARTLFHSSSGGRTASADEVFGGAPVPYLRSVEDPPDHVSPYHDWTVTLSDEAMALGLRPVLQGDLLDVQVVARTASGRAATVRVTGTLGTTDVPGTTARQLLALRSTWFTVTR